MDGQENVYYVSGLEKRGNLEQKIILSYVINICSKIDIEVAKADNWRPNYVNLTNIRKCTDITNI